MTSALPTAPYGVIVNVYLPWLTLSLGYVQVQGMWLETGRIVPYPWKGVWAPRTRWQEMVAAPERAWKTEK